MAVSDSRGAIYSEEGLDPEDVSGHKHSTGSVLDYPGAKNITNEEIAGTGCGDSDPGCP